MGVSEICPGDRGAVIKMPGGGWLEGITEACPGLRGIEQNTSLSRGHLQVCTWVWRHNKCMFMQGGGGGGGLYVYCPGVDYCHP